MAEGKRLGHRASPTNHGVYKRLGHRASPTNHGVYKRRGFRAGLTYHRVHIYKEKYSSWSD